MRQGDTVKLIRKWTTRNYVVFFWRIIEGADLRYCVEIKYTTKGYGDDSEKLFRHYTDALIHALEMTLDECSAVDSEVFEKNVYW